jgi:hypothetical protein
MGEAWKKNVDSLLNKLRSGAEGRVFIHEVSYWTESSEVQAPSKIIQQEFWPFFLHSVLSSTVSCTQWDLTVCLCCSELHLTVRVCLCYSHIWHYAVFMLHWIRHDSTAMFVLQGVRCDSMTVSMLHWTSYSPRVESNSALSIRRRFCYDTVWSGSWVATFRSNTLPPKAHQ